MADGTDQDNGNGRVTMALLAQQLKWMEQRAVERHAETMEFCERSEKDRAALHEKNHQRELENHQRELEITKLKEQQTNLAKVQVVVSAAMSAAAGVLAGVFGK